ncbi:MAG: hypothetical protein ACREBW_01760, partial [Candidatus Micrarchaeaceae archaeon]
YIQNGNLNNYFSGIGNVSTGINGFFYRYVYTSPLGTQTWNNTSLPITTGDIVTNKLVLSATANVINDDDSGYNTYNGTNIWAVDNLTRDIHVWQTGVNSFFATVSDVGTANIIAGRESPGNVIAVEPFNGTATIRGQQNVTFNADSVSADAPVGGSAISYNMNGASGTGTYFNDGLSQYFPGMTSVAAGVNGFTYTYVYNGPTGTQTWVNSGSVPQANSGDIVTNKLIINSNFVVKGDEDTGLKGYWALDNYTKTLRVWQIGATNYTINSTYSGTWCTFAGALSPESGIAEPNDGCGPIQGGYNATLNTAVPLNASANTIGSLGTFNYGGTQKDILLGTYSNNQVGNTNTFDWIQHYFPGADESKFSENPWGWTYTYNAAPFATQTWVNAGTGSSGDIVTNKLVLFGTSRILNDPDSGNHGYWALDNLT